MHVVAPSTLGQFVSSDTSALAVLDLSRPGSTRPSVEKKHFDERGWWQVAFTRLAPRCAPAMIAGDGAAPTIRCDEHPRPREFS